MKIKYACGMLAFLLATTSLMSSDNQNALEKDYALFNGVWAFNLVVVDGAKQPDVPFETNKMIVVSAERRFIVVQGKKITRGIFQMDPTRTPKQIDVTATNSQGKSLTTLAIYELEGDTYKVCSSFRSNERPSKFLSKPGSETVFEVLKRSNQSVQDALAELDRERISR
jgi:uncharacterized protein (TIGR03067 family)